MTAQRLTFDSQPFGEINTTPLIDVMLVLLVMFILTIPVATHITELPLPSGPTPKVEIRQENTLSVTPGGAATWNGVVLDRGQLAETLKASLALKPEPLLKYAPDPQAPYGASAEVLALVKQTGVGAFGFVGNERHKDFGKASAQN